MKSRRVFWVSSLNCDYLVFSKVLIAVTWFIHFVNTMHVFMILLQIKSVEKVEDLFTFQDLPSLACSCHAA